MPLYFNYTKIYGIIIFFIELLYVWGIIFMFITTLIALFKKEKNCSLEDDHVKLNTFQNYRLLWDICKLPSIQMFGIALLTVKVSNKIKP